MYVTDLRLMFEKKTAMPPRISRPEKEKSLKTVGTISDVYAPLTCSVTQLDLVISPVGFTEDLCPLAAGLGQPVGSHHPDWLEDAPAHVNRVIESLVVEEEGGLRRGQSGRGQVEVVQGDHNS